MKTDDLIKALAADASSVEPPIARTLAVAVAARGRAVARRFPVRLWHACGFFQRRDEFRPVCFQVRC